MSSISSWARRRNTSILRWSALIIARAIFILCSDLVEERQIGTRAVRLPFWAALGLVSDPAPGPGSIVDQGWNGYQRRERALIIPLQSPNTVHSSNAKQDVDGG